MDAQSKMKNRKWPGKDGKMMITQYIYGYVCATT